MKIVVNFVSQGGAKNLVKITGVVTWVGSCGAIYAKSAGGAIDHFEDRRASHDDQVAGKLRPAYL